ncbi:MAG: EscU/YscU/HrcU family type III secretion system export apparatus switch protein [Polyangiaceae bacterium]
MSEKTEAPTARRLRKAREEGDSGASSFAAQSVAFASAVALAPVLVESTARHASAAFTAALRRAEHPGGPLPIDAAALPAELVTVLVPSLLAVGLVGAAVQIVQTGGVLSTRRIVPDLRRLDPLAGLRALLSAARLWSIARALAGGALVGWLAYLGLRGHLVDLARLARQPTLAGRVGSEVAVSLGWQVAAVGLAFGVVDLVVLRSAWLDRLKMTRDEVRREHKDAEGDPQLKAARARAHHELLAQATLANVREASVVVVNPTHLACALRYDADGGDEAPVVVASGEGDFAARIVDAAREAGVPVVRDVPLARALVELEVGDAIPEALYQAVAEILREVWED